MLRKLNQDARYYRAAISPYSSNALHLKNPWVAAWWSAAFPGLGHLMLGAYLKGFILFIWEFFINVNSHLNEALLYSFTGQFDLAKEVLNPQWILLYVPVYVASIWDSYRATVDVNKLYVLAEHEKVPIIPFEMSTLGLNFLDRRHPWVAFMWSLLMPGLGHLYLKRLVAGFFILVWWMIICTYYSNILIAIHLTMLGDFSGATDALNAQWVLFMPSIYGFVLYESYQLCVEYNRLFRLEQTEFLKRSYQELSFHLQK